MKTKKDIQQN